MGKKPGSNLIILALLIASAFFIWYFVQWMLPEIFSLE